MTTYVNFVIIYLSRYRVGGININHNITLTKDTKIYINEYGIFYEGQTLEQFCFEKGTLRFIGYVYIKKFITHYNKTNGKANLYFRMANFYNKVEYTINCNQLGILYKSKR